MEAAGEAIWVYNKGIVDAVYDLIPAVKPQIAMYEQFGIPGLVAFQKTVNYCKEKGLVVIGDETWRYWFDFNGLRKCSFGQCDRWDYRLPWL